jgi:F-type H+-transporting ATPase subunit gamma
MKAVAAASIGDYERAVAALGDYYATVERGLGACFRDPALQPKGSTTFTAPSPLCIIVFGTDQGLVGQFNDRIADFTVESLKALSSAAKSQGSAENSPQAAAAQAPLVWTVGERVSERLGDAGLSLQERFDVPNSVKSIIPLISNILLSIEARTALSVQSELHLFYNRPGDGPVYSPVTQRLLPLDQQWCLQLAGQVWPSNNIPEMLGDTTDTLGALVREYLFVSMFRASAESLSSENASRLAAMQRADRNIEELLDTLRRDYHRQRQASIDEEMFDVIAGSSF